MSFLGQLGRSTILVLKEPFMRFLLKFSIGIGMFLGILGTERNVVRPGYMESKLIWLTMTLLSMSSLNWI